MSDYHLHLWPHRYDESDPIFDSFPLHRFEQFTETAAAKGITDLGFSEHLYRCREAKAAFGEFWQGGKTDLTEHSLHMISLDQVFSLEEYVEGVLAAKAAGMPVKLGLEVDFFPGREQEISDLIAPYPWDFLLGSVHWVGEWSIDSEEVTHEFGRRGVSKSWEDYFEIVSDLIRSRLVDVLAHVDVCKKFGFRPETEPLHLYQKVAEASAANGVAVEVSSQGLRNLAREIYPSPHFLEIFRMAGVPITFASDAHSPEQVGDQFEQVRRAAYGAGYREFLGFDQRRRIHHPFAVATV